jgi:hypothetical protein
MKDDEISQETWKEVCNHGKKTGEAYMESDFIPDEISGRFILVKLIYVIR